MPALCRHNKTTYYVQSNGSILLCLSLVPPPPPPKKNSNEFPSTYAVEHNRCRDYEWAQLIEARLYNNIIFYYDFYGNVMLCRIITIQAN